MSWLGANVYVSEGRNLQLVRQLEALARSCSSVAHVNTFVDEAYNRTSFTLLSKSTRELAASACRVACHALQHLDLQEHHASHPRLGSVDHISCHPMEQPAQLQAATSLAQEIGEVLASRCNVPVFFYGAASPSNVQLADVRRAAGYFRGAATGTWTGALSASANVTPLQAPDLGPVDISPHMGLTCIGAVPWLVNYNVLLKCSDLAVGRRIARAVSERGGGLRYVQAMALQHGEGIEVACNILDEAVSTVDSVLECTRRLAAKEGIEVHSAYRIGRSPEELVLEAHAALIRAAGAG